MLPSLFVESHVVDRGRRLRYMRPEWLVFFILLFIFGTLIGVSPFLASLPPSPEFQRLIEAQR